MWACSTAILSLLRWINDTEIRTCNWLKANAFVGLKMNKKSGNISGMLRNKVHAHKWTSLESKYIEYVRLIPHWWIWLGMNSLVFMREIQFSYPWRPWQGVRRFRSFKERIQHHYWSWLLIVPVRVEYIYGNSGCDGHTGETGLIIPKRYV